MQNKAETTLRNENRGETTNINNEKIKLNTQTIRYTRLTLVATTTTRTIKLINGGELTQREKKMYYFADGSYLYVYNSYKNKSVAS